MILNANALNIPLANQSVHCCVTSPPYWRLRDYGVDGQIGLEETIEEFVQNLVEVFREVWRVLRDDGTCWVNLGDSYSGNTTPGGGDPTIKIRNIGGNGYRKKEVPAGLKLKDLMGIPWRVAFALQADGWYLRSDIIWHKPNPMPESVQDRPTSAHEYIFLLSKSRQYYYDAEVIKEKGKYSTEEGKARAQENHKSAPTARKNGIRQRKPAGWDTRQGSHGSFHGEGRAQDIEYTETNSLTKNKRTVWTVPTSGYSGAHFATFPPRLIEPCILAGCPEKVCPVCGAPFESVIEKGNLISTDGTRDDYKLKKQSDDTRIKGRSDGWVPNHFVEKKITGYKATCEHRETPVPGIVLDPFFGSGTTGEVATKHHRRFVGLELNPDYCRMAQRRNKAVQVVLPMGY